MDLLYGSDEKFGDLDDSDMSELLESDVFPTSANMVCESNYMDTDWLNTFFDDPILNDKMITDAAQPCIKSEHSYSLNEQTPSSPLGLTNIEDIDTDFFCTTASDVAPKDLESQTAIKQEALDSDPLMTNVMTTSVTATTSATLLNKQQPTMIVTSTGTLTSPCDNALIPHITIKQEPPDTYDDSSSQEVSFDSMVLPPTPPSSGAGSDSDGSLSPQRSAPSSPIRQLSSRQNHHSISTSIVTTKTFSQPLFVNPISQSGILMLSEEEKRTLISEGYPIPGKLPLTKQEEKNLKKIRRKIKNKISAQESRRKKKEYLEALEKRVESYTHENSDLKKKIDSLENNNRSLLGQLQKLQALVSKVTCPSGTSATQTGTVLMVLVLCFAVFLGGWSPTSLNIGYSASSAVSPVFMSKPEFVRPAPAFGPAVGKADIEDDYSTPNMKSRMLLSLKDDVEEEDDVRPLFPWQVISWCASKKEDYVAAQPVVDVEGPVITKTNQAAVSEAPSTDIPVVLTARPLVLANETTREYDDHQALMHPDIAVAPVDIQSHANLTADIETA
ncbi:cyclic AMP-responsive element-binding protein 3-like protein 1 [Gigantopelta aegis]|uniref:cyclic AMP-responsive element-binding protein 3-like protein 1 n=1 Tax=Gigantopelta aegis TaxID=1735272 RepID=UPI001B887480|nr:cyclic AMP-responsive element-binding protein 3-like protein 1 [Gigantopelta aegis]